MGPGEGAGGSSWAGILGCLVAPESQCEAGRAQFGTTRKVERDCCCRVQLTLLLMNLQGLPLLATEFRDARVGIFQPSHWLHKPYHLFSGFRHTVPAVLCLFI